MFNLGHALPLTFVRFSCCARRLAHWRERYTLWGNEAAAGRSHVARRICEPSRQQRHSHFVAQCCVSAARFAALVDSNVLLRL